jgi:hypothetical protein
LLFSLSKILNILSQDLDILENDAELERLKIDVDGKNLYIINIAKLDNIEISIEIFKKIIEQLQTDINRQLRLMVEWGPNLIYFLVAAVIFFNLAHTISTYLSELDKIDF